jgi:hypothetical protein
MLIITVTVIYDVWIITFSVTAVSHSMKAGSADLICRIIVFPLGITAKLGRHYGQWNINVRDICTHKVEGHGLWPFFKCTASLQILCFRTLSIAMFLSKTPSNMRSPYHIRSQRTTTLSSVDSVGKLVFFVLVPYREFVSSATTSTLRVLWHKASYVWSFK